MRYYLFIITLILSFTLPVQAQQVSRNDLEKRRQAIVESLKETQAQLDATKKDHKATVSQLQALQAKLSARERLISNINQEMSHLDNDIKSSSNDVIALRYDLKRLQERYAQSVRYAYANRSSYNMLTFIFSSGDFNDALRRVKYMRKYRDFRKNQVEDIRLTQNKIEHKINVLNSVKNQKGVLLTAEEQQKLAIQEERNETNKIVVELKGREQELVNDIDAKKKTAKRLDNAISDAIRKEIEIARKKAEEEERRRRAEEDKKAAALAAAKAAEANQGKVYGSGDNKVILGNNSRYDVPKPPATTGKPATTTANNSNNNKPAATTGTPRTTGTGSDATYAPVAATVDRSRPAAGKSRPTYTPTATPETSELAKEFESNRGRLPWPVERGVITDQFGKHKHAVATRVEIENNGIDIQTSPGAKARAIYDGTVTNILSMPGTGNTILVKHGKYYSVYSGLSSVSVKTGDNVSSRQTIGTVGNNEDGIPEMNFQIWRNFEKLNPSQWIAPM